MQDDEQDGLEPDEELVLPEEDELDQRRREKLKVDLPERTRGSPLLRRVIVGDAKEKGWRDEEGKEDQERSKRERVDREIGQVGRKEGAADEGGATRKVVSRGPVGEFDELDDRDDRPALTEESGGEAERGGDAAEVFTKMAPSAAAGAAPTGPRRRRTARFDQESEWEGRGRSSLWWLGAGLLCVLLVAAAVFVVTRKGGFGTEAPGSPEEGGVPETSYESLPIAEFVARSSELLPVVREVLKKVESGTGGAALLRGGEQSLLRWKAWRQRYPAPAPFREMGLHEIHASGNDRFAYLILTGEREGFTSLMAYFVKEDGRMLFDWEATEGYSEVLLDEVEILKDGTPRMMRGVIALSSFYTDVFPEKDYRCYTLHHDDPGEWIWAYAEREGEVDFQILSHMQTRDPLGRSRRVTVKLTKEREGSRANQVEIQEFLFGGWIEFPAGEGD